MRRRSKRVKVFPIIIGVIIMLVGSLYGTSYIISENNYTHNLAVEQNFTDFAHQDYIQDQSTVKNFKYGLTNGTEKASAWVAIYNVLNYLKRNGYYYEDIVISDIIKYLDFHGAILFGKFGTNPLAVKGYLSKLGFKTDIIFDERLFVDSVHSSTVNILMYTTMSEGHFTALRSIDTTNAVFYNPSNNTHFGNYMFNENKDTFKALITIKVETGE